MEYLKTTIGLRFLCTREVVFGLCDIKYKKGKIYKSEIEGCITNEDGCKEHEWIEYPGDPEWKNVFRIFGNKRRSGGRLFSVHSRRKDAGG
jgi:hypothetical protein